MLGSWLDGSEEKRETRNLEVQHGDRGECTGGVTERFIEIS
jgi:hypothetical protein